MSDAQQPGAGTPPAAAGAYLLPPGMHEYAVTLEIVVLARDVSRARVKAGQQVRSSMRVISIEPTPAERARYQQAELGEQPPRLVPGAAEPDEPWGINEVPGG